MQNDRDNKYEGQEESEYHFTDEDVSYEVEPPPTKQPSGGGGGGGPKQSLGVRLSQSKRIIISGVVFLVLVFVVYKMVAPTSTVQTTDIANTPTPPAQVAVQQNAAPTNQVPAVAQQPNQQAPVTSPPTTAAPTATMAQAGQVPGQPVMTPPAPPAMPAQQAMVQQQGMPVATAQPTQTSAPAMQPNQQPPMTMQQQMGQPVQQTQMPQQPLPPQQAMQGQGVATMPAVIPVQSAIPYTVNQPAAAPGVNALASDSERVMTQFQAEYIQKLNDYAAQSKATQEQLQALSARVINMEAQLHQLVQALTHQRGAAGHTNAAPAQPHHQQGGIEPRYSYSVQAIIPGRAWLRSDAGETVTVAEGDMIKDLGKVTKIDPYDGIVEVNTGTKMVSLSYGNGS
jgi:hypothetical protein